MKNYNLFENLLFRFCEQHTVALIQPDENLHYVLFIDAIEVRCFSNCGFIYFQAELSEPTSHIAGRQHLLKHLMQHSLLAGFTTACTLSINKSGRLLIYQKRSLDEFQFYEFEAAMEGIVDQAEGYLEVIESHTT